MKRILVSTVLFTCLLIPARAPAQDIAAIVLANAEFPNVSDQALIDHLEQDLGMEVIRIDQDDDEFTKNETLDSEEPDVIFIQESVSSGNVNTQLNNRPEPIIVHEPYLYDDMGFVVGTSGCGGCWGDQGNDFGNMLNETDVDIVNPDHLIIQQAGLEAGTLAIFDPPGRLSWGTRLIDDAEILVVATNGHDADGDGVSDDASLIVIEEGSQLLDGTDAAGLRIGGWIFASSAPDDLGFTLLTEEGLALWDACLLYALGKIDTGPPETRFVRGDVDGDGSVTLTDGIATLGWLFEGSDEPPCLDAADTDDDGKAIINDAILIFGWLFSGGASPAAPSPTVADYPPEDCGLDEGDDQLGCAVGSPKCSV